MSKENLPVIIEKDAADNVRGPYKAAIMSTYAFWRSIPFVLRLAKSENLEKMGFDLQDEAFKKLLTIKTKTDFSAAFGISTKQLKRWDQRDDVKKMIDEFNHESNVMQFKSAIDFSFTKKTIQEADPYRVELWYKIYTGWNDKIGIQHGVDKDLASIIRGQLAAGKPEADEE